MLILAAMATVSLACHNRAEDDEVGAAPDQGDTTAVTHVIDSTRTGPPGVGGRPGDATVTADSVGVDSAVTNQEDPGTPVVTDTTSTWTQDTLAPQDTGMQDSTMMQGDSVMMEGDSVMMHGDSAVTNHPVPDTTSAQ
jgi:hypothetical protein